MFADAHVVADLNLVVELDAIFQNGIVQGTPIDRRVGADFHIVADSHRAELRDFDPLLAILGKTEAPGVR